MKTVDQELIVVELFSVYIIIVISTVVTLVFMERAFPLLLVCEKQRDVSILQYIYFPCGCPIGEREILVPILGVVIAVALFLLILVLERVAIAEIMKDNKFGVVLDDQMFAINVYFQRGRVTVAKR